MNAYRRLILIFAALLFVAPAHQALAGLYHVTDLGTLGGTSGISSVYNSVAAAINNSNQVVGWSYAPGSTSPRAFLYSGGTMTNLGTLGGTSSQAFDINNLGQIAGGSDNGTTDHAFIYSGGSMQDLGPFPGGSLSIARGINDAGQVVGVGRDGSNQLRAFGYSAGTMTNLGTLGGTSSFGVGINASGQMVGQSFYTGTSNHAFLYQSGAMQDLLTLQGGQSDAWAINNSGLIVGSTYVGGAPHAATNLNGVWADLGTIFGDWSQAFGVNSQGHVVGMSGSLHGDIGSAGLTERAFISIDGTMLNLNNYLDAPSAGWQLRQATDINDNGWIVGIGRNPAGELHAFMLAPVPEPTSIVLAAIGLAGMAVCCLRRRKSARIS